MCGTRHTNLLLSEMKGVGSRYNMIDCGKTRKRVNVLNHSSNGCKRVCRINICHRANHETCVLIALTVQGFKLTQGANAFFPFPGFFLLFFNFTQQNINPPNMFCIHNSIYCDLYSCVCVSLCQRSKQMPSNHSP